jgi:hypothetical protein
MTNVALLLLLVCAIIGFSILVCLLLLLRRLKPSERLDSVLLANQRESAKVPQNEIVIPTQILPPDIEIAVLEGISSPLGEGLPTEIGHTLEPVLRSIPALANVAASSGGLIRITFSPEVTKGLADGSLALMQRVGGFQATAVNSSGQIVGNGVITLDRAASSVAVASAVWQILSVVTAQKFLSDINQRLAAIEEGIKRLETWLDSQEQGKFLGSMKYMATISQQKLTEFSTDQSVAIKNQLEQIYHDSLQSIAANSIRAEVAVSELVSKKFDGNLKQNEAEFRRLMESYFVPASYAIRFKLAAASSECLAAFVERRPDREIVRLDSIVRDAEEMLQTIKADAEKMRKKAAEIKGSIFDTKEDEKAKRKSIRSDIETLVASCEESIQRIRSMRDDAKRIGAFTKELESNGLSVVAKLDSNGKVIQLHSDGTKKGSAA